MLFCVHRILYVYRDVLAPVAGDNAKLQFSVPGNGGLSCLEFYYHMYGDTMGTLTVFSGSGVVFNASGNHGNTWIRADVTIHLDGIVRFICRQVIYLANH